MINESPCNGKNWRCPYLRNIKGENALIFLFPFDQTLKKLEPLQETDLEKIAEAIIHCVDKIEPEKSNCGKYTNDWPNNKLKNELTKRIHLFQNWIKRPTEKNRNKYKEQRDKVTTLIKNAVRQSNFDKLGKNQNAKTTYRNLKSHQ